MITTTIVKYAGQSDNLAVLEGDFTGEAVRSSLLSWYPQLSNATFAEVVNGETKTITFSEATGSKA
jgi:hypothetical protein